MATNNLRTFLNTVKRGSKFGKVSPLNTFKSVEFDFGAYGKDPPVPVPTDLIYYIQDISIPQITVTAGDAANSPYQSTSTIKSIFGTNTTFDISFINTTKPIPERIFLPWLNQTRNTVWAAGNMPYALADVTITFKEKSLTYYLFGCRPTGIEAAQPTQKPDANLVRKVTFNVDFIHATL